MRECRPLPGSRMLESNGFDAAAEKCVLLFQLIDRGVQLCDNRLGLIGEDDQFDIDLLVLACRVRRLRPPLGPTHRKDHSCTCCGCGLPETRGG